LGPGEMGRQKDCVREAPRAPMRGGKHPKKKKNKRGGGARGQRNGGPVQKMKKRPACTGGQSGLWLVFLGGGGVCEGVPGGSKVGRNLFGGVGDQPLVLAPWWETMARFFGFSTPTVFSLQVGVSKGGFWQ